METRSFNNKKRKIEEKNLSSFIENKSILDLKNLIDLCDLLKNQKKNQLFYLKNYGINKSTMKMLINIVDELHELNNIVGVEDANNRSLNIYYILLKI